MFFMQPLNDADIFQTQLCRVQGLREIDVLKIVVQQFVENESRFENLDLPL